MVTDTFVDNDDLVDVSYFARSRDGIVWEPVLTDPCADAPDTLATGVSKPEAFGDGWLVSYDCARDGVTDRYELQLLDSTGANPRLVARMDTDDPDDPDGMSFDDSGFGTPVTSGDVVIVPEIDLDLMPHSLMILQLQPAN